MLLKRAELEAIRSGAVRVVFRRWRRPTVKAGGSLTTAIGVLAIGRVETRDRARLTARDATDAGFESLSALRERLDGHEGEIYRIEVRYGGADPRIALRDQDALGGDDLAALRARLRRLDAASAHGAWTLRVLRAIERHPGLVAAALAERLGVEREWLKPAVRKLKNLGLTTSLPCGYELAPRGKAVLRHLERRP